MMIALCMMGYTKQMVAKTGTRLEASCGRIDGSHTNRLGQYWWSAGGIITALIYKAMEFKNAQDDICTSSGLGRRICIMFITCHETVD